MLQQSSPLVGYELTTITPLRTKLLNLMLTIEVGQAIFYRVPKNTEQRLYSYMQEATNIWARLKKLNPGKKIIFRHVLGEPNIIYMKRVK